MDVALILKNAEPLIFDLNMKNQDLEQDGGLRTAVIISLFTNKRVTEEELPPGEVSKEGWWGDLFPDIDNDKIGSKLWLLSREKATTETLNKAREFAKDSLLWLTEDGIAETVSVDAEWVSTGVLGLSVYGTRPQNKSTFKFDFVWNFESSRG